MTEKRFKYCGTSQIIKDNLTGYTYYGNKKICDLLNQINDRADRNAEKIEEYKNIVEMLKTNNQKLKLRLKDLGVEYYD